MQTHRLSLLCEVFRVSRKDLLRAVRALHQQEIDRTLHLASAGVQPWVSFHLRGDVAAISADMQWLAEFEAGQRQ